VARLAEFAAGRACARTALGAVGVDAEAVALLPDARGAVRWPDGTVGSISHTRGWTGAVAARRSGWGGVSSLGLDAEADRALADDVLEVVASHRERDALRALAARNANAPWSVALFAAKEAAYKAWYPLTGEPLVHDDIRVRLSGSRFTAVRVGKGRPALRVAGRWTHGRGIVVALAVIRSRTGVVPVAAGADRVQAQWGQLGRP
jgi:4'-phosphopantetheinyl transferase EntD